MHTDATGIDEALEGLARSRARVQVSRRLLSDTRYRIAASRRRLNPAFAVAGSSDDDRLRAIVRARLDSGELFPVNGHSWAGYGSGKPCAVCGSSIGGAEIEYEVEGPTGVALAHLICFMAWQRESEVQRNGSTHAGGAILGILQETHADHIVLNDDSLIFFGPKLRCAYPAGTRLQIVYAESDGKKIALSIERYKSG